MSKPLDTRQYVGQKGEIVLDSAGNVLWAQGNTVPTDGTSGYSKGAYFNKLDGTAGSLQYVNEGTATSCDFNAYTPTLASSQVVQATAATLTVTEALHQNRVIALNRAGGIAVTLPTAAPGLHFTFIVQTTFTGAASIKSVTGADIMIGHALMGNDSDNTTVLWQSLAATTNDTLDLFGTANSTGGIAGQKIEIWGLAVNVWHVEMTGDAAGTEATPFANTVA